MLVEEMSMRIKCVLTLEEVDDITKETEQIFEAHKFIFTTSEFSVSPREVIEQMIDVSTTEVNAAGWRKLAVLKGKKK